MRQTILVAASASAGLVLLAAGTFAASASKADAARTAPVSAGLESGVATTAPAAKTVAPAEPATEPKAAAKPAAKPAPKSSAPAKPRPAPKPAKPEPQYLAIDIGVRGYEPSVVQASSTSPITLTVAKGEGCAAGFLMPSLGIAKDNSGGPVTFSLGRLDPGTYKFTCGMEMVEGKLVVR